MQIPAAVKDGLGVLGQQRAEQTQFQQNTVTLSPPNLPAQSFADVLDRAEKGDAESQFKVGRKYYFGDGVVQDIKKAVDWHARAAAQGNASAQYVLGLLYSSGEGVPHDKEKAVELISTAAEQGLAEAQYTLGMMYSTGENVAQDNKKGDEWISKAAAQGNEGAKKKMSESE
ncbi:MAG: tetratricopeptide repeat protein [Desulfobulbus sp.]|nr:tetratricopeptide repeat protein [Desulfobulbus sp.]